MSFEEITFCDTFYPTIEEFQDFKGYLTICESKAKSGIIKVVPPSSWKARGDNYKGIDFSIPYPIEQIINGNKGIYELLYIQKESKTLSKYRKNCIDSDKITDGKKPIEIENLFWKTLKFSPPIYGADTPKSIFDKNIPWNLSEIDSVLKKGLENDIMGVTTPYLYVGAWKTLFGWHKEDLDLYSINFLHFGKPKFWYGIPQEDGKKFDDYAKKCFPEAAANCSEFLRHKTYLINPLLVRKAGIRINKLVQNPGEFVITFAGAYHAGFNSGFNCAEAVNFALDKWIDLSKKTKPCKCIKDSVIINLDKFCENLEKNVGMKNSVILTRKTGVGIRKRKDKIERNKTAKIKTLGRNLKNYRIKINSSKKTVKKKAPLMKKGKRGFESL